MKHRRRARRWEPAPGDLVVIGPNKTAFWRHDEPGWTADGTLDAGTLAVIVSNVDGNVALLTCRGLCWVIWWTLERV